MALVMIVGLPTSGKTYRASQLCAFFESRLRQVPQDESKINLKVNRIRHISEHALHLPRSAFNDRNSEKTSRASLYSACKRELGKDAIVVLDAGNYIKGYRYQLHCEAKAAGVRSCVIHVGTIPEKAKSLNQARLDQCHGTNGHVGGDAVEDPYDEKVWEELVMRFEEPNPMARWDRPLWAVVWEDRDLALGESGGIGVKIWNEVICGVGKDGKALGEVKMHQATVLTPASAPNHLHELDRITQGIISLIQAHVQDNADVPGGSVQVQTSSNDAASPGISGSGTGLVVNLPSSSFPSFAHLQRLRRQFISLHRQQMGGQGMGGVGQGGGGLRSDRIALLFVDWLNDSFAG